MKIDLDNQLFQSALPVLSTIESHGYEAYFVGGCVRDTLLELPIHDIDIASSATPDEIEAMFKHTFEVGKEHGTIVVLHNDVPYEVTTFRTEGAYSDFRRPDEVQFVRNLEEDTLRRDFTINALAFDHYGNLYDYHQGLPDLKAKLIRAVGTAQERFNEDALRMIRAIRFASQLGFTIEAKTFTALQELAPLIENVSIERIRIEISKFFQGEFFHLNGDLLPESGLPPYIKAFSKIDVKAGVAGLKHHLKPLIENELTREESFVWALFLHSAGINEKSTIKRLLSSWTHSNQLIRDVQDTIQLLLATDATQLNSWFVYQFPDYIVKQMIDYLGAHQNEKRTELLKLYEQLPIYHRKELQLDGRRIMQVLNMEKGGPIVGKLLLEVEKLVVMGQLENDEQLLLNYVKQAYQSTN